MDDLPEVPEILEPATPAELSHVAVVDQTEITPASTEPVAMPAVPEAPASGTPLEALDLWFDTHIRDSVFSRNTQVYNQIHSAVALIKVVMAGVKA